MWLRVFALFLFTALEPVDAIAARIPPFFMDCVVVLGGPLPVERPGEVTRTEWRAIGTGFFYGYLIKDDPEPVKRQYAVYLVTAKHVVQLFQKQFPGSDLQVRLNPRDSSLKVEQFSISSPPPIPKRSEPGRATWHFHTNPNVDVAIVAVDMNFLRERGFSPAIFANDQHAANRHKLKDLEVTAGDAIFVLGFPMGLVGEQRNYVIVRDGIVARLSEMLDGASEKFMIDAFVFPGNSGGPVILRPDITSISGTKSQSTAYLIGLVTSYQPYIEAAISAQTSHTRVTFEENSGLADVIPTDFIDEAIEQYQKSAK
jgi:hypothetical protein